MPNKYVPILRWKDGKQEALKNLSDDIKKHVVPSIEVPYTCDTQKNINDCFQNAWNEHPFYFYLKPEWYEDNLKETFDTYYENFTQISNPNKIPVFDLSNLVDIKKSRILNKNGIAVKIQNNEFGLIESYLSDLCKNNIIDPNTTDLILDLRYAYTDDYLARSSFLKAAMVDIENIADYRSVIVSSCSFPKELIHLECDRIYRYTRNENKIHHLAQRLSKRYGFHYVYSDHGPSNLEEMEYTVGTIPNFRIKYTTPETYLFIKGKSIKQNDADNDVSACCQLLISNSDYNGKNYSWGDGAFFDMAMQNTSDGISLSKWAGYNFNHHITFVVQQIL